MERKMESRNPFANPFLEEDYIASYRLFRTSSVELSPPKSDVSSSTQSSSSSDTQGKRTISSISDDDVQMMAKMSLSSTFGEEMELPYLFGSNTSSFVPQGILANEPKRPDSYYHGVFGQSLRQPEVNFNRQPEMNFNRQPQSTIWDYPSRGVGNWNPWNYGMKDEGMVPPYANHYGKNLWGHPDQASVPFAAVKPLTQPRMERASRKYFEFPEVRLPREKKFRLEIFSERKIYYVEDVVTFVIYVLYPPKDFRMKPSMIEAVVHDPRGDRISVSIQSTDSHIANSLHGSFKATEDIGIYELNVRMTLPEDQMGKWKNFTECVDGKMRGSMKISVSKNYGVDSQKECLQLPCEYQLVDRPLPELREAGGWEAGMTNGTQGNAFPSLRCKLWGLACDLRNNNLFYSDRESHEVVCVSPRGHTVFKFGRNPRVSDDHHLRRPSGIAFDEIHNRLVICDKDNHRVCFYTMEGDYISSFGSRGYKNGTFEYPWDVAVSPNGTIVVSDSKNKRIQFFDNVGNYLTKYTVFEVNPFEYKAQFDSPRGICFDNTGSYVYVTDFNVNNIVQIPLDVTRHKKLLPMGTLHRPQGIAMDKAGNLLVADSRHDCVRLFTPEGDHLLTMKEIMHKPMSFPINVTVMAGGFAALLSGAGNISIF